MHSLSKVNLFSLLAVLSVLVGLGAYSSLSQISADDFCTTNCGYVTVTITGVDTSGTAMVGLIDITKPDGTKAPTDSARNVSENKTSQRSLDLVAGSGYSAALSLVSSKYQVKAEAGNTNPRTVAIVAGQSTDVTFNLETKDSSFVVLHNILNPDKSFDNNYDGRFLADLVGTDSAGKTYTLKLTHTLYSTQNQPYWTVRPGTIKIDITNINSDYEVTTNPVQTIAYAGGSQSIDILFKKKASTSSSFTGSGGNPDPTPTATVTAQPTAPAGQATASAKSTNKKTTSKTARATAKPTVKPTPTLLAAAGTPTAQASITASPTASSTPRSLALAKRHISSAQAIMLSILAGLVFFGLDVGVLRLRARNS